MVTKHRVEDDQQFAGAGDVRKLFAFSAFQKTAIKGSHPRVAAGGAEHRHVQRAADAGAAAPDHPAALELATLVRMRGDPDKCGDLATSDLSQFRNFSHQGASQMRADAGDLLQNGDLPADAQESS